MRKSSASFRRLISKTAAKYRPPISGEFSVSFIIFSCTPLLDAMRLQRNWQKNGDAFVLVHEEDRGEMLYALTHLFNGSVLGKLFAVPMALLVKVLARISIKNMNITFG